MGAVDIERQAPNVQRMRLLGAEVIGEFAWSIENLLNRIMAGTVQSTDAIVSFVGKSIEALPSLVEQLESGAEPDIEVQAFIDQANAFAEARPEAEEMLVRTLAGEAVEEAEAEGGEMDPVLRDIFTKEASEHLKVLQAYIASRRDEPPPHEITEELHRACHTLSGSANMAGVAPAVAIAAPLNQLLRRLHEDRAGLDEGVLGLCDRAAQALALVAVDLLWVPLDLTNEVRASVAEKTGIPGQNVMICASNTHFGPKIYGKVRLGADAQNNAVDGAYVQTLTRKIADAVYLAHKDMGEAKVGTNRLELAEITYHRRPRNGDGSVSMAFSLPEEVLVTRRIVRESDGTARVTFAYPDGQPQRTFGPIDPAVWVLRVEGAEGELLASVANFACHAVSGSRYPDWFYSISADYPGETMRVVERVEGGVCLFTSGTAGDIVPLKRGKGPRYQIGRALAGAVVRGLQFVPMSDNVALEGMKTTVEIPLKKDLSPDRIMDADGEEGHLTTEIQVLRLGDIYLLGLPGEILVEVGLEIRKRPPARPATKLAAPSPNHIS